MFARFARSTSYLFATLTLRKKPTVARRNSLVFFPRLPPRLLSKFSVKISTNKTFFNPRRSFSSPIPPPFLAFPVVACAPPNVRGTSEWGRKTSSSGFQKTIHPLLLFFEKDFGGAGEVFPTSHPCFRSGKCWRAREVFFRPASDESSRKTSRLASQKQQKATHSSCGQPHWPGQPWQMWFSRSFPLGLGFVFRFTKNKTSSPASWFFFEANKKTARKLGRTDGALPQTPLKPSFQTSFFGIFTSTPCSMAQPNFSEAR